MEASGDLLGDRDTAVLRPLRDCKHRPGRLSRALRKNENRRGRSADSVEQVPVGSAFNVERVFRRRNDHDIVRFERGLDRGSDFEFTTSKWLLIRRRCASASTSERARLAARSSAPLRLPALSALHCRSANRNSRRPGKSAAPLRSGSSRKKPCNSIPRRPAVSADCLTVAGREGGLVKAKKRGACGSPSDYFSRSEFCFSAKARRALANSIRRSSTRRNREPFEKLPSDSRIPAGDL
jgi:hypothetical protein